MNETTRLAAASASLLAALLNVDIWRNFLQGGRPRWIVVAALWLVVAAIRLIPLPAHSAPPPGANRDSAIGRWVQTLKDYKGVGCCDLADCRPTVIRVTPDGTLYAWIGKDSYGDNAPDDWMPVSKEVLEGTHAAGPAPDSRTWACFYNGTVMCLLPGGGF